MKVLPWKPLMKTNAPSNPQKHDRAHIMYLSALRQGRTNFHNYRSLLYLQSTKHRVLSLLSRQCKFQIHLNLLFCTWGKGHKLMLITSIVRKASTSMNKWRSPYLQKCLDKKDHILQQFPLLQAFGRM